MHLAAHQTDAWVERLKGRTVTISDSPYADIDRAIAWVYGVGLGQALATMAAEPVAPAKVFGTREKAYEAVDATVFSSDMLYQPEDRAVFTGYLARWNTAFGETQTSDLVEGAEPAAWAYQCGSTLHLVPNRLDHYFSVDDGETFVKGQPLYRHPAASAQAGAVPEAVEAINLAVIGKWPEGFAERLEFVWKDVIGFVPNYKLYDLQRVLAEFGFVMEVRLAAPKAGAGESK